MNSKLPPPAEAPKRRGPGRPATGRRPRSTVTLRVPLDVAAVLRSGKARVVNSTTIRVRPHNLVVANK